MVLFIAVAITACRTEWHQAQLNHTNYDIIDSASDGHLSALIAPYRDSMALQMNRVIAHAAFDLPKSKPESLLGNLVADIIAQSASAYLGGEPDFSLQNYGGLRIPKLAAGPITIGRVYELMPFENYITIMRLEGGTVLQLVERMAADGGWPVNGLRYEIENGMPENITIAGKPFQSRASYTVALPDYIANGGDRCWFLKPWPKEDSGILIRDAIISYMKQITAEGKSIAAEIEGRVHHAE